MAKQGWACERCGAAYRDESTALQCEADHASREAIAHIPRFMWQHEPNRKGEFPAAVKVQFTNNLNDFGIYKLSHIGLLPVNVSIDQIVAEQVRSRVRTR